MILKALLAVIGDARQQLAKLQVSVGSKFARLSAQLTWVVLVCLPPCPGGGAASKVGASSKDVSDTRSRPAAKQSCSRRTKRGFLHQLCHPSPRHGSGRSV